MQRNIKIWIYSFVFAMTSLAITSHSCPYTGTIDQTVEIYIFEDDPEPTFFKTYMNLRAAATYTAHYY